MYYLVSRGACPVCPTLGKDGKVEDWECPPCKKCDDMYSLQGMGWEKDAAATVSQLGKGKIKDIWAITDPAGSNDRPLGLDIAKHSTTARP